MNVQVSKGYDIKNSYAFDVSEYMQKQNSCMKTIICFVRKETEKAILLEELFGYRRLMWFPKSQLSLIPQKGLGEEKLKVQVHQLELDFI